MGSKVENYHVNTNIEEGDCCPECNASWDGGDALDYFKGLRENEDNDFHIYYKSMSEEQITKCAENYGWTPTNGKRIPLVVGVELSYDDVEYYDGISYYMCPGCNVAWNVWDGNRSERFINKITSEDNMGE